MAQENSAGHEDIIEYSNVPFVPLRSTDSIISSYENKIGQSIASKILTANRQNKAPSFTKEELLYLNKRAEVDDSELKVITPTPAITLKKGKTELNIGHAAVIVQKMEEKWPTTKSTSQIDEESLDKANSQWREAKVFKDNEYQTTIENPNYIPQPQVFPVAPPSEVKTVNKNAYEIREAILAHALDWVKYTNEFRPEKNVPSEDEVLSVAQKFYKFVENKR